MLDLSTSIGMLRTSCPSTDTVPAVGSIRRGIISTTVLLPEPVRPTLAGGFPAPRPEEKPSTASDAVPSRTEERRGGEGCGGGQWVEMVKEDRVGGVVQGWGGAGGTE